MCLTGTFARMTKLRRYLKKRGPGALAALAKDVGKSHTLISRIADGHRGASLETALAISEATGIAPSDLLKVNAQKPARKPLTRSRT